MPNGPFSTYKLLGASLISVECGLGWNDQQSWAQATLVEDRDAGDHFSPPMEGQPVTISVGALTFGGLLQSHQRIEDMQGNPRYSVRIVDPREVLAGTAVLLDSYIGTTSGVPNLLNPYGYWESKLGFGGSMSNESGMLWEAPYDVLGLSASGVGGFTIHQVGTVGIAPAIAAMTATGSPYGGPLQLVGNSYRVDLGGLPPVPQYYRQGGTGRSLLDMISELCQDAGHDYFLYLDGDTIRFRSVDRTAQPVLGTVANFVMGLPDATVRNYGIELRNDVTNAVILGGNIQELVQVLGGDYATAVWPYWGKDSSGNVIVGSGDPTEDHTFTLDCSAIAAIVGSTSYQCSVKELRCAMVDYESWAAYTLMYNSAQAEAIGIVSSIDSSGDLADLFPDVLFRRDLIEVDVETLAIYGGVNEQEYWTQRGQIVYDFVRGYAEEYYGKKWLVRLPFPVYWRLEPETLNRVATHEVSDGGYVPEGGTPIGIDYSQVNAFMTDDGRFGAFVAFGLDPLIDFSRLSPDSCSLSNGSLYVRAQPETEMVYLAGDTNPYVVLTLDNPVYQMAKTPLGDIDEIASLLQVTPSQLVDAVGIRHGSFPFRVHPKIYVPGAAAVPIRDNRNSYGPWMTPVGVPGKVVFERDESLTPWNYGDFNTMGLAAQAKLAGVATRMQQGEVATAERPGEPEISLGDSLVAGGPNVTGLEVNLSSAGISTRYTMQTYTPQYGAFQRQNADRLRRLGLAAQQARKQLRTLFLRRAAAQQTQFAATVGWMQNTARAVAQMTPHETILATMGYDRVNGLYRTMASTATVEEFAANVRVDNNDIYSACGGVSLEGLYRPFSCQRGPFGSGAMPHFETPNPILDPSLPSTDSIDPLRDSDVDIVVNAPQYARGNTLHRLKGAVDWDTARGVALKMPMVLEGWGYELTGRPIPNAADESKPLQQWSPDFMDQHKLHPERWRVGALLDVKWDDWRKGWAVPTMLKGELLADLRTDDLASAKMAIYVGKTALGDEIDVWCELGGAPLKAGTTVYAMYYALEDKWKVFSAACS